MLTRKGIIDILREKQPYLRDNFGVKKIGLFGSYAKGQGKRNSDIDIFVEFKRPMGFKFMEFADYIEKLLGRKADILTLPGVSSIRVKKISKDIKKSIVYV